MKCPYCNESIGIYATKAEKRTGEDGVEKQFCRSCHEQFQFSYPKVLTVIIIAILLVLNFNLSLKFDLGGTFWSVFLGGLSFSLAVAITIRPEKLPQVKD